jgi:hypothetical protein
MLDRKGRRCAYSEKPKDRGRPMKKQQRIDKVKVIYFERHAYKTPKGKPYQDFRWMGYYREDGKRKRVYVGPKLPDRLKHLAKQGKYTTPEMFDDLCVNS